ncbi:phosphoserine phosphatase serb [Aureobasidium subglaciale]|nr:phosphoserine phosphatase serb [Aureobasidium subglaciale]
MSSVNYETFSFAADPQQPAEQTKPKVKRERSDACKNQVVALVFLRQGSLDAEQWKNVAAFVTYTLQEELSIRRSLSTPRRFLDGPGDGQDCRVLEIAIPLPQKNPSPTLLECSAITRTASIISLCQRHNIEVVLQPQALYVAHRTPGLAVFDMDSTLIQQEVIDELARAVGRYAQVSAITEAAMRGEAPYTDFEASLRARVGHLAGVPVSIWEHLRAGIISFTPGARELIRVLSKLGWKTAVLSGGFTPLAEWVKQELGLDYCYANHLVEKDGHLTGELVEGMPIIHAEKKRTLLQFIAEQEGIPLENVIAVGDGSNDLLMMHQAGLGIAFNAKPKVQMQAPTKINADGLLDVAYILGCTVDEVTEILRQEMVLEGGQYVLKRLT